MFDAVVLIADPELTREQFDVLLPIVSPEQQMRIKRYRFFRDARNTLLGDILARHEICRATGLDMESLDFSVNAYGKPFITNLPNIHFNISHAGRYVACAVADEPVGIDIELIVDADMDIAERYFTPDEIAYIKGGQPARRFFEIWTKKESRIKWEGKGLFIPLTSFSVLAPAAQTQLAYHEVLYDGEAICHTCSAKQKKPSVKILNADALLYEVVYKLYKF